LKRDTSQHRAQPRRAALRFHVDGELLRFWIGDDLVKTAARTSTGEVRNKRPARTSAQA
jgi:hypothetical protein